MGRNYNQPALDTKELIQLIRSKNITIDDAEKATFYLKTVSYHRLSPYIESFINHFDKQNTCYAHLIVLAKLIEKISPDNTWKMRLKSLLQKHDQFPIHEIGFLKDGKMIIGDKNES